MNRKKEITNDLWDIMRKIYNINDLAPQSAKQEELLTKIVEYIDENLSTRRKRQDKKDEKKEEQ
jgi:hypothetical protein